ncbi:MAG: hypothetical protein DRR08_05340 [Candidatus Parabeggiatoa sp. nov. 2]|nr:MAG: hypothetical protein B6247_18920 [Beggiatoa sp. 4572_84]RKZ62713.1 MAG: hypothetical protein DRR08_05340 [Gammaproteobacteria bacterium]
MLKSLIAPPFQREDSSPKPGALPARPEARGVASPRWGSWGVAPGYINIAPLGLTREPGALPQAILISPRWGSWGVAPGYINIAPLGLTRGNVIPLAYKGKG